MNRTPLALSKITVAIAALSVSALLLSACQDDDNNAQSVDVGNSLVDTVEVVVDNATPELPVTVTDAAGDDITIESIDNIVSLSGNISEIVYALGLGDNVVGRDVTTTFDNAADVPVITKGHDVSAEGVLSVDPDIVLATPSSGPDTSLEQIKAAGVPIVIIDGATDLDSVPDHISTIATILGMPGAGDELIADTQARISEVLADIPDAEEAPRVAFLYLRGSASVYMIGGTGSGATSLIEAAGGIDAGAEAGFEEEFVSLTPEAMAQMQPDVLLVMEKGLESVGGVEGLAELSGIAQTDVADTKRIVALPDGTMLNYGPRTDDMLRSFIDQMYS